MAICPKCRSSAFGPITLGSANWVCGACGYKEYRSNSASPSVNSTIKNNRADRSDFNASSTFGEAAFTIFVLWLLYQIFIK